MKKFLVMLLCLTMVLSLVACGKNNEEAAAEQQGEITGEEPSAGLANPWTEYESLEEINNEVGCNLCKPAVMGVSDEHFAVGDMGEFKMAEYRFTLNGYEYCFRCAPVTEDISGLNYDEVEKAFAEAGSGEVETVTVPDTLKVARWMTIDGQYVLSVMESGEMDEETFDGIAEELYTLTTTDMFNDNGENG